MAAIDVDNKLEFVFDEKKSPCSSCHAASILPTAGGTFLVTWFGGSREGEHDVAIWVSHRSAPGAWSTPTCAAKVCDAAHWNPVLARDPGGDGSLWLFFKVGNRISHWVTYYVKSTDEGHTWSAPRELVPGKEGVGGRGPVKNKPIVSSLSRHWLAPASDEKGQWSVFLDRSEDNGATWTRTPFLPLATAGVKGGNDHAGGSKRAEEGKGGGQGKGAGGSSSRAVPPDTGVIQPSLWESAPGRVHMLMRSDCGFVCRSDSEDDGRSWRPVYKTRLPNNNSGLDVAQLALPTSAMFPDMPLSDDEKQTTGPGESERATGDGKEKQVAGQGDSEQAKGRASDGKQKQATGEDSATPGTGNADAGTRGLDAGMAGTGDVDASRTGVLPLVLCHNPVSSNWGDRYPLRVSLSWDNGDSWQPLVEVGKKPGEYSYPSVVALPDGGMAMVFTWRRVRIAFLTLTPEQVCDYAVRAGSVPGGHVEAYRHPSRSLRHFTHDQFELEQHH
eukprot:jgi/Mesvir1/27790/Mv07471-RA.1